MKVATISGRLGRDIELRVVGEKQTSLAEFDLAVTVWNRETRQEGVEWYPVIVWGRDAEFLANYSHKGDAIAITGELIMESYTSTKYTDEAGNGAPMKRVKVKANLGGTELFKKGVAGDQRPAASQPSTAPINQSTPTFADEDDIPF